jgi:hypothetical protein
MANDSFSKLVAAIDACTDQAARAAALSLLDDLQQDARDFQQVVSGFVAHSDDHPGVDAIVRAAFKAGA